MASSREKPSDEATSSVSKKPAKGSAVDNLGGTGVLEPLFNKAAILGLGGLAASVALGSAQGDGYQRFMHSYLAAYMWALAIVTGAVFWVTLQNLVNAKWSIALRRLGEVLAATVPVMALLALPIVVPVLKGDDTLYVWASAERMHSDHELHKKAAYLNPVFFAVRFAVYFGFWTFLSRFFLKQSLRQDESGAAEIPDRMQRVAGPSMIAFALTLTFCAFDFLMSLDPFWFSTIFGVYYFASAVLCANSSLVLIAMWLQNQGRLTKVVTVEHYHDLGKMMFAFTIFWAYIGFSQFMLIWYANLPEETAWFKERFAGNWADISTWLLFAHFVIPFFGLLSRHVKRHRKALAFWAFWILGVVYLDMFWLVMPSLKDEHMTLTLVDLTCVLGMAGVLVAALAHGARGVRLIPVKDPRLDRSLGFENI